MRRSLSGSHSWAISKVKELESGELYPLAWFCRDCGTKKTIDFMNRPRYEFPEGHEQYFQEGLPPLHKAGTCPFSGKDDELKVCRPHTAWGEL